MFDFIIRYTSKSPELSGSGSYSCKASNWKAAVDLFCKNQPLITGLTLSNIDISMIQHRTPSYGSD